ncbi:hypothetical protein ACFQ1L_15165 [Phytohabitans flavus]|nr:hypothetical protein [Phytohabitans flavus]
MVAALLAPKNLAPARQSIKGLIMPGQRRLHFQKESNGRRKQILDAVAALGVEAIVYDGHRYASNKPARDACLARLVTDLTKLDVERLILETEDGALKSDKALIFAQLRSTGDGNALRYAHMRAYEESLLAIPDAIAWSWAKGGHWRARISEIVSDVRKV